MPASKHTRPLGISCALGAGMLVKTSLRLVSLVVPFFIVDCSSVVASNPGSQASEKKSEALCAKLCKEGKDICATKLSPYSDSALDSYESCKGDTTCIKTELSKKEPGADAVAYGKWSCKTCGVAETDSLCSDVALTVSPYSTSVLDENRTNCEQALRDAATASAGKSETALKLECSLAVAKCFKVTLYGGQLCKAP